MAGALGRHELSAGLLGAIALTEETGQRFFPIEREEISRLAEAARAHLGEARFAAALARGQEHDFVHAFEQALYILENTAHLISSNTRPPEKLTHQSSAGSCWPALD